MQFGSLQVDLVTDGIVYVDVGGPFGLVPRKLYDPLFDVRDDNTVLMAITCLLLRSHGKTILVDTGLGEKLSAEETRRWGLKRKGRGLMDSLAQKGIAPEDIDIVINTHLHSDHCGGNTRWIDGELKASFPRAEYWVQRIEWAEASHPDARTRGTYFAENFEPLFREDRLRLLHGAAQVTDHVRCVPTPGHTRGHQSVVLAAGNWRGFFTADLASFAINFVRLTWLTSYDVFPLENLRTKRRWQKWALEKDAWIYLSHDPTTPVIRLVERDGHIEHQMIKEMEGDQ